MPRLAITLALDIDPAAAGGEAALHSTIERAPLEYLHRLIEEASLPDAIASRHIVVVWELRPDRSPT